MYLKVIQKVFVFIQFSKWISSWHYPFPQNKWQKTQQSYISRVSFTVKRMKSHRDLQVINLHFNFLFTEKFLMNAVVNSRQLLTIFPAHWIQSFQYKRDIFSRLGRDFWQASMMDDRNKFIITIRDKSYISFADIIFRNFNFLIKQFSKETLPMKFTTKLVHRHLKLCILSCGSLRKNRIFCHLARNSVRHCKFPETHVGKFKSRRYGFLFQLWYKQPVEVYSFCLTRGIFI